MAGFFRFLRLKSLPIVGPCRLWWLLNDRFLAGGILMRRFYRIMRVVCWKYGRTMCRPQNPLHFYDHFRDSLF
jgi:hypothetical protein